MNSRLGGDVILLVIASMTILVAAQYIGIIFSSGRPSSVITEYKEKEPIKAPTPAMPVL